MSHISLYQQKTDNPNPSKLKSRNKSVMDFQRTYDNCDLPSARFQKVTHKLQLPVIIPKKVEKDMVTYAVASRNISVQPYYTENIVQKHIFRYKNKILKNPFPVKTICDKELENFLGNASI